MTKEIQLQQEWERGYVAAVANIMRTHKADVIAVDVLRAAGNVNWKNIPSDNRKLLKAIRQAV